MGLDRDVGNAVSARRELPAAHSVVNAADGDLVSHQGLQPVQDGHHILLGGELIQLLVDHLINVNFQLPPVHSLTKPPLVSDAGHDLLYWASRLVCGIHNLLDYNQVFFGSHLRRRPDQVGH
eukprot:CAMPEP_0204367446 /NCGR_PEP_ID=MMETSP0469-20131031/43430_1 /ASSEMBLY_ACC=CAM_ASM_000384 /TAXON_ID=2969 /ORGANISM="Oxyrrhis marina" /LENGTH=121 /DNA_ID=CAMNT_0051356835 /DNA_START=161 /DNA_END=523 /DNA_ORIENTATION=-